MKVHRTSLALALLLVALPLHAQQIKRQYDETGRYLGYESRQGDVQRSYDAQGRYQGYDRHSPNEIQHYDSLGLYRGRTTRSR